MRKGIHRLEFTEQLEIIGMISAEGETLSMVTKIYPAKAKVSRWMPLLRH